MTSSCARDQPLCCQVEGDHLGELCRRPFEPPGPDEQSVAWFPVPSSTHHEWAEHTGRRVCGEPTGERD
jgi:hypothetical protein